MKLLLVGPYPPPHGGISVHVRNLHALMQRSGVQCRVLNIERIAPLRFVKEIVRHTYDDWILHVHTNGHNPKSWLVALACGLVAHLGPGCWLTLHSGMMPEFVRTGSEWRRTVARLTCLLYERIICVNDEIAATLGGLGIPEHQLEIKPAYLPTSPQTDIPAELEAWLSAHSPILSTAMFFRPEYGFELLVDAVERLREKYPKLGCIVMGDGEGRPANVPEGLFLTGDVDHEVCLAVISRSDVFVRPTFHDGDSISVREALALGIPVVASNVGARPEGTLLFEAGDVDGLVNLVEKAVSKQSPLLEKEGWTREARPEWSLSDHPVCAFGAAAPPFQGGESTPPQRNSV